ncbi:MAG: hypothetical protein J5I41_06380 [Saprospiraceae bacterium]|nr:hypothetical protein [Saprospiraceae bacterium]
MKRSLSTFFMPASTGMSGILPVHGFLVTHLILLVGLVHLYDLEPSLHLKEILITLLGAFIIQPWVPGRLRPHFFVLAGWVALLLITGLPNTLIVITAGLFPILITVYVQPWKLRYLLLGIWGVALITAMASGWQGIQPHLAAISILGSMFMFRLTVFLYDKPHQKDKPALIRDISYFFMLPNYGLLLFPVVDYRTFLNSQTGDSGWVVYKKGIQWLTLGLFHLVVYRFFYSHLLTPVNEVNDLLSFMSYAATNYLLIIRLSGIFHTSVGILCLCGYDLPPVFNNYFLASGFSDLWRRINIYFREYLIKVFYYPVYFRLRHWGNSRAVVLTILVLFVITWLLHSFQWFWLKGRFPVRVVDILFWGIFGLLVATNAWMDLQKKRGKTPSSHWVNAYANTARILGMFLFMSVLWSLWSAGNLSEWLSPIRLALQSPVKQYALLAVLLLTTWIVGGFLYRAAVKGQWSRWVNPSPPSAMASFWALLMTGSMLLVTVPAVHKWLDRHTPLEMSSILTGRLNAADEQKMIEGYYTEILIGNELTNPLAQMATPQREQFRYTEGALEVDDFRQIIHKPGVKMQFKGKPYRINSSGLRDREYPTIPAPGTIRTIFLGGSFVSGSGVGDEEVFDEVMENMSISSPPPTPMEFINAGSSGYDLIDAVVHFDKLRLGDRQADYAAYISHGVDMQKCLKDIALATRKGIPMPYPFLEDIVARAGIRPDMSEFAIMKALEPFAREVLENGYRLFHQRCIQHGIRPVWIYWPTIGLRPTLNQEVGYIKPMVTQMGYRVIDLTGIYDGRDPQSLYVAPNDRHPNAEGHRLFARALLDTLLNDPGFIDLR